MKHWRRVLIACVLVLVGLVALAHIGGWQALLVPGVIAAPLVASFNTVGQCGVGGIILLLRPPFEVGDTLTIEGQTGTVASIGLLHTWMTGPENASIPVPNSKFMADIYSIARRRESC